MPKNRNRTVTNNFEFPPEFLKTLPYPEEINVNSQKSSVAAASRFCFGEPVPAQNDKSGRRSVTRYNNTSSSSDYDNVTTSGVSDIIDIVSFGKSSSSSVSWSDEFDTEASQRVQIEFERMERVLQGKEAIPSYYNRDEYEQWIRTFPQLSITGENMKCPIPVQQKDSNETPGSFYEEIIAFDLENCDRESTSSEVKKINNIKNAVIDQVFKSISSKILEKKSVKNSNRINNVPKIQKTEYLSKNSTPQNLTAQFDSFLRISPVLLQESTNRSNYLDTSRQHSSHSVSRSDKLASKWMKEEPIEYSSLPYISTASAKNKSRKTVQRKNSTSSKSRYSSKQSPNRNRYVSLPPIKTLNLPSANQYRSISATPRQPFKRSSAASVQADSILAKNKSGFEVSNYLTQNGLEPSRKNVVKYRK